MNRVLLTPPGFCSLYNGESVVRGILNSARVLLWNRCLIPGSLLPSGPRAAGQGDGAQRQSGSGLVPEPAGQDEETPAKSQAKRTE